MRHMIYYSMESVLMSVIGGFFLIGGVIMFFDRAMCVQSLCSTSWNNIY